jgi:hypothetical protein
MPILEDEVRNQRFTANRIIFHRDFSPSALGGVRKINIIAALFICGVFIASC